MSDKKESVFELSSGMRVMLVVLTVLAVLALALYVVTGMFVPQKEEPVLVPSGNLSSSIFDAQNMVYSAVSGLDNKYELPGIPFTVDIPAGSKATVGNAMVVSSEPYYFYYNVVSPESDVSNALAEGLTSIVAIDADKSLTASKLLYTENGFINGCEATYCVVELIVDGVAEPRYVVAYKLHLGEKVYRMDKDIIVGCMSTELSTERLANLQGFAEVTVGTLAFSEDYKKRLEGND